MHQQQAAQGQFVVDVVDHGCGLRELSAKTPGHDNGDGRIAGRRQFLFNTGQQSFDHAEIAPEHTGLHRTHGASADYRRRAHDIDLGKLRRHPVERIQGKAWPRGNDTATEGAIRIDDVEGRARPNVDHDQRRWIDRCRRQRIQQTVGASFPWILDPYLTPKMYPRRADAYRFNTEMIDAEALKIEG